MPGLDGQPVLMQETYVVMKTPGQAISRAGWTELERDIEMRWWSLDEIASSDETIYAKGFANLLRPILAGDYPDKLVVLPAGS